MLLGHWGTTPAELHLRALEPGHQKIQPRLIYVPAPGHGGPAVVGNTYLEGTYSEIYPTISQDEAGLRKLFVQFSFPEEFPATHRRSARARSTRAASWAIRSAIRSGRCTTIPISSSPASSATVSGNRTAGHRVASNKFLNPANDGAVLPILQSNGYKISNPTVLARIEHEELEHCSAATGGRPTSSKGHEPELMA